MSADKSLRTLLAADMIGNSVCQRVKRGKTGRHFVDCLYEREGERNL